MTRLVLSPPALRIVVAALVPLALAACQSDNPRLMFMQVDHVGAKAAVGPNAQGGSVSLGYKGLNVARVPVTTRRNDGSNQRIEGRYRANDGRNYTDAHSVFGRFEATAAAGQRIILGKHFSTGFAARHLANGYQDALPLKVNKNFVKTAALSPGGTATDARSGAPQVDAKVTEVQQFLFRQRLVGSQYNPCGQSASSCDGVMGSKTRNATLAWLTQGFGDLTPSEKQLLAVNSAGSLRSTYLAGSRDAKLICAAHAIFVQPLLPGQNC